MVDDFSFEDMLNKHKRIKELSSTPSRVLRIENLNYKVLGERKLYKFFGKFGEVTYINLNPLKDNLSFVYYSSIEEATNLKNNVHSRIRSVDEKDTFEKCKISFEVPFRKKFNLLNSSRHLWIGSIDDKRVDSDILMKVFSVFGVITDRPHIYKGENQGFVDFSRVYEAVEAMYNMNGVCLGTMAIVIRFGRQEYGKDLWVGGLGGQIGKLQLRKIFSSWGPVSKVILEPGNDTAKITYDYEMHAQKALDNLQGLKILGRRILLDYYRNPDEPQASGSLQRQERNLQIQKQKELDASGEQPPNPAVPVPVPGPGIPAPANPPLRQSMPTMHSFASGRARGVGVTYPTAISPGRGRGNAIGTIRTPPPIEQNIVAGRGVPVSGRVLPRNPSVIVNRRANIVDRMKQLGPTPIPPRAGILNRVHSSRLAALHNSNPEVSTGTDTDDNTHITGTVTSTSPVDVRNDVAYYGSPDQDNVAMQHPVHNQQISGSATYLQIRKRKSLDEGSPVPQHKRQKTGFSPSQVHDVHSASGSLRLSNGGAPNGVPLAQPTRLAHTTSGQINAGNGFMPQRMVSSQQLKGEDEDGDEWESSLTMTEDADGAGVNSEGNSVESSIRKPSVDERMKRLFGRFGGSGGFNLTKG